VQFLPVVHFNLQPGRCPRQPDRRSQAAVEKQLRAMAAVGAEMEAEAKIDRRREFLAGELQVEFTGLSQKLQVDPAV
jgi:hypothetical protein